MQPVGLCLPGMTETTRAPWPVWRNSTTAQVRYQPMTIAAARRLYRHAEDFEAQTRQHGRQDGALGRGGLKLLDALLFRFMNWRTGQLDPSYAALAAKAIMSARSVARGLKALRAAGVLHWQRRCQPVKDEAGRVTLEQETNAYGVCPPSQWKGYTAPAEAPPPESGTWGDHPCGARDALTEAVADAAAGASLTATVRQLETDPDNKLAAVLARLGRAIEAKEGLFVPDVPGCQRNTPNSSS